MTTMTATITAMKAAMLPMRIVVVLTTAAGGGADEMGLYDVPATMAYIQRVTGRPRLSYIGFSQGSAQGFIAFSLNPQLAACVDVFIALAPAGKAKGFRPGLLRSFVSLAPDSIFLLFGRRALMEWALFWRGLLSRGSYGALIEHSCWHLFGWSMKTLGPDARRWLHDAHLYSYTSVKTVVHWMQVAALNRFQMYDERHDMRNGSAYKGAAPLAYPVAQIKCPVALIYGSRDELTDIPWIIRQLPRDTYVRCIDDYEHLCPMWAESAAQLVFPHVVQQLLRHTARRRAEPAGAPDAPRVRDARGEGKPCE